MIDLFILETCPYCQKVINFAKEHSIKFNKYDTANEDNVLRLLTIGGKDQVPFLYDSSKDVRLYESDEIIKYLSNI